MRVTTNNTKAFHWEGIQPFLSESTGERWVRPNNNYECGKHFHVTKSAWCHAFQWNQDELCHHQEGLYCLDLHSPYVLFYFRQNRPFSSTWHLNLPVDRFLGTAGIQKSHQNSNWHSEVDVRIVWLCLLTFGSSYQVDTRNKKGDNIWLKITESKQWM